jgi:cyclic beta-1,2-glucan synthetase
VRASADEVADRLLGLGDDPAEKAIDVVERLGDAPVAGAFAVQVIQRLRDQDPSVTPVLTWLNKRLKAQGTSPHEVVSQEHHDQAAANVTVRNIITSMRWMSSIDWPDFFESVSLVDEVLRKTPGFGAMDFKTRDEYRKQIERLSRGSGRSEIEVAREAVALAQGAAQADARASDRVVEIPERAEEEPGYYLISKGRAVLEKKVGFRCRLTTKIRRAFRARPTAAYMVGETLLAATILAVPLFLTWTAGAGHWSLLLLAALGFVPATDIATSLIHRLIPVLIRPSLLPKLEFAEGVPPEYRTIVVVPTLLTTRADIEEQIGRLEVHYLGNPAGHLHFALLTDWVDAPEKNMPGDEDLLAAAADGIARLNKLYGSPPSDAERFLLYHRRRCWNERDGKWMGWERKRGKLHELNLLLRGAEETTFIPVNGRHAVVPQGVRYVITLDADTRLPKGAAYRLVGAMAHPLNRPRFDPEVARVVAGYGILQPVITLSLPTGPASTAYQRIITGPGGVDPYAAASSDVYQDLFGEGSYTGKGIYDIDAYEMALEGRIPDNTLLSHDLFEGVFARAGLVTDVDLFEKSPSNYEVDTRRQHRWVRGDWQLLPWILGNARRAGAPGLRSGITIVGWWKMVDNLRRSLSAPTSFGVAVASWTLPMANPILWTSLALGSVAVPAFIPVLDNLIPRRRGISKRSHLRAVAHDVLVSFSQIALGVGMMAHRAWLMLDAVLRTLVRLYITKRNLLEWVTAARAGHGIDMTHQGYYRRLRWGVILAAGAGLLFAVCNPASWPVAAPLVLLWCLSPEIARRLSLTPRIIQAQVLSPQETRSLRLIARRTWRFFETFVRDDQHALPPDNFQEDPKPVVAYRTSPTNVGLYLLSTTCSHDFGWIGIVDMVERLEATLESMTGMRRFRGHFLNWYDTRNLKPLEPMYVSTVDSGNLAGHLLAVSQCCRELIQRPLFTSDILDGVRDALELVIESVEKDEHPHRVETVTPDQLRETAEEMLAGMENPGSSLQDWANWLAEMKVQAENLLDIANTLAGAGQGDSQPEILTWAMAVLGTVQSHTRDLEIINQSDIELTEARSTAIRDIETSQDAAGSIVHRLSAVALLSERIVQRMNFRFLFDPSRKLFSIGFSVVDGALDPSCYDLLASESRLASFVAIAKGDIPPRHWFLLGRSLTPVGRGAALVSWSGSMFEYLMPLLVMQQPPQSLLDLTSRLVVKRQIRYGAERKVPWGVSESAYNVRDVGLTYQYSDFGVPGLGLKRGLFEDVVVAPYATALAAMVNPGAALNNFSRLKQAGALGSFGFYEALDYTPSRLPEGAKVALVGAYMAHHQAMTIVSLGNALFQGLARRRFHDHPMVRASELLLQERTPRAVAVTRPRGEEVRVAALVRDIIPPTLRRFESPHDITPRTHLLSNGRYTVMVTAAGSGFSQWKNLAITRWREDTTRDHWGSFFFLRDTETGEVWSAGFQPSGTEVDNYDVIYSEDRAKIVQHDRSLSITLEIVVSPEDDAELRRLTVTNLENRDREIDFTSYSEIVLAPQNTDEAHPAFSKLFVETEFVPEIETLLATRRQRSMEEPKVWLAHLAAVDGDTVGPVQFESDRSRFLGRGRGVRTAQSVIDGGPLSNTEGAVLDPIAGIRRRVKIPQGETVRLVFTTLVASTRDEALEIAEKYRQTATFERESSLAWTQAQVQLHHLRITHDEAHLFQRLANRLVYADPTLRAAPQVLARNMRGTSGLWAYGISGDLPIALVRIERDEERNVARQMLRAHEYWRMKGVVADLVILNARGASYAQDLQKSLEALVKASQSAAGREAKGEKGNVFVLRADLVPARDRILIRAAARVVILAQRGTLSEQVVRLSRRRPGPVAPRYRTRPKPEKTLPAPAVSLAFFNGLGGFTPDGSEYVTVLAGRQWTPAPWINVIANEQFGFQVSESGAGYTWAVNSRENKLTPWSNDPVSDTPGETFYVRDEESGLVWGPTLLPIRKEQRPYVIRHGQGYSCFEHESHGIALSLLQFVPTRDPIKISRLIIRNSTDSKRQLAVTGYAEWVLGVSRSSSAARVITDIDLATGALIARNVWNEGFADRVAFADLGGRQTSWTGDRLEFLGRNASLDHPSSPERGDELSLKTGAGLDPCAALQTKIELAPGESTEVLFLLGQAGSLEDVRALVKHYRRVDCDQALSEVKEDWSRLLETVQVKTPEPSIDLLLNRWLLYQTLSCRIWSRSAFYQAGGAYGFRDQLQDVLALAVARPEIVREHIIRAAARQFREGDVQHWWHPPTGRGVRTRISDDRLWLPYAVVHYLRVTEDWAVLDEESPWLDGPALEEGQQEAYFEPKESEDRSTLYEHCARALDRSLETGSHGLPLMGAGDWNDGMNRVGHEGRGESVWLAWFLLVNLRDFAPIADRRGEDERAARWLAVADSIKDSVEREAWDGQWYRRAFFDIGTPLGSADNVECQIDSIAQSWAVLSGAGDKTRARQAMESVERNLLRREAGLLLLLSPPFDQIRLDPGYIKGYVPGIRENGGQYTHAAVWSVLAFAMLGEGDKSVDLFKMVSPIRHSSNRESVHRYRVEPYAVAADVYSEDPLVGRGGWTWYTGAAGWLYRAGLEWILGFQKRGSSLRIDPCIPRDWKGFEITYRYGDTRYRITVKNPKGICRGVSRVRLDATALDAGAHVPLSDDGREHLVEVELG